MPIFDTNVIKIAFAFFVKDKPEDFDWVWGGGVANNGSLFSKLVLEHVCISWVQIWST